MVTRRQFAIGAGAGLVGGFARIGKASAADGWSEKLAREFARLEAEIKGRLGVAVLDTGTGESASHSGDERFPMCSTFKFLASGAVLVQAVWLDRVNGERRRS